MRHNPPRLLPDEGKDPQDRPAALSQQEALLYDKRADRLRLQKQGRRDFAARRGAAKGGEQRANAAKVLIATQLLRDEVRNYFFVVPQKGNSALAKAAQQDWRRVNNARAKPHTKTRT